MQSNSLAYVFSSDRLHRATEEERSKYADEIISATRKLVAKSAGSREMIDTLMQHLIETDWDECHREVVKEERERDTYYDDLDNARKEEKLNKIVECFLCRTEHKLRETINDDVMPFEDNWAARFCQTCFESKHLICLCCQKDFITTDTLLNKFELCLKCKRYENGRVNSQTGRARKYQLLSDLDLHTWVKTLQHFKGACAYCGQKYRAMEHYLPIELGGGTTATNCLPSCYRCNTTKKDKHPNNFESLFPSENITRIKAYFASL